METPLYIALASQTSLRRQLDVVANNVANMSTTGYKAQQVQFAELVQRPAPNERYSVPIDLLTARDTRNGPLLETANPLDVALDGEGYLVFSTLNGDRYSRNGQLQIDSQRRLTSADGLPVLNEANQPITIPANDQQITITSQGDVQTETGLQGRLRIVRFENERQLEILGNGLYATEQAPQPAAGVKVIQGMREGSNVQPIMEANQMIELLRRYQQLQKLIDDENDRIRTANRQIPRLSAA